MASLIEDSQPQPKSQPGMHPFQGHPALAQLAHLIAEGFAPFRKGPPLGYQRGIDFYSAGAFPWVLHLTAEHFRLAHGRYPDMLKPQLLSDKLYLSKFFRPMKVPETGNKLLTHSFIPEEARELVRSPEIVWRSKEARVPRGTEVEPGVYYLKTSHGCDMYRRLVYPISNAQAQALDREFGGYLKVRYGARGGEWWYSTFEPELLLEKAVGSAETSTSFNYYVIAGEVVMLVPYQKHADGNRKSYYTPDFTLLPEDTPGHVEFTQPSESTKARLLEAARMIGERLSFARVDFLLDDEEQLYLGEVTFTPGNALSRISRELDLKLGQAWDLEAEL